MKRYHTSSTDNFIGGVCGGLGEYTGVDPLFWRIIFFMGLITPVVSGFALPIYLVLWFFSSKPPKSNDTNEATNGVTQHTSN